MKKLADDNPTDTGFRSRLADSHNDLGNLLKATGRTAEAEAKYRRALEIFAKLADDHPAVTDFRSSLAIVHNNLGNLLAETGRPAEAEPKYRRALEIKQKLAADNPKDRDNRNAVASCHSDLSVILRRLGRPGEARDGCDRAIAIGEALVRDDPKAPAYRNGLASSHRRRGQARRDLGDLAGAAADARTALELWEGVPSRDGEDWFETACTRARAGGPGRLGRLGRRGGGRGRRGDGAAPQGRRDGLPQPRRLPYGGRARPAPQSPRLPPPDDGPGHARRPVRRSALSDGRQWMRDPPRKTHRIHECIVSHKRESSALPRESGLRGMARWHRHGSDHAPAACSDPKDAGIRGRVMPYRHVREPLAADESDRLFKAWHAHF